MSFQSGFVNLPIKEVSIAPGHMRSTVSVHNTNNRPVIWTGAILTPRGEGRFTGVVIPLLKCLPLMGVLRDPWPCDEQHKIGHMKKGV